MNRCEPVSLGDVKMWKVRIQNGMRGQKSGLCRVTGAQSIRKHHKQIGSVLDRSGPGQSGGRLEEL